ncbi:hypothetical protein BBJ29_004061 [Phytophthora kernoviae]|uniref:PDEase domain-containing protein n=1 Tax=Phytophthora kernoviae TaxID=325452 RepID=A0A3F2RUF5_9STRA|nr:hypothetical protein BBJ29_004061 [Phytophthora kernoviae]RLN64454.1 hypothetical protein BBP00_00003456 [Phytophthora kernoviae]
MSSANLDIKEELSAKLNYQLHYEMGDILRILCQIKVKMNSNEKRDIDKIITALVRNQDLFEVTLSSKMPDYEEEVQGWLHMMDFKDHPAGPNEDPGHAAAVVADINFYLRRVRLNFDDGSLFVGLVAAAGHDIAHPGVSNGFLIATKSNLAITYSDDTVLERMHIAELYRILSHDAYDVFSHMSTPERAEARKIIIGMILATDLARHFQRISVLKTKKFAVSEEAQGLELSLLMETMLMLADLGHTAKPFDYHQSWAERISEEFFRQGETEEHNNLPMSPLCDRNQANLPRSQVTFLTLVATPLFETAGQVFAIDDYDAVISELRNNISVWKERIESTDGTIVETISTTSSRTKLPKQNV